MGKESDLGLLPEAISGRQGWRAGGREGANAWGGVLLARPRHATPAAAKRRCERQLARIFIIKRLPLYHVIWKSS